MPQTLLQSPPEIPYLSRFDQLALNGLVSVMEPQTEILMRERALAELVGDEYDSPHSRPWHVSMHASEFPGSPEDACARYLTYRMMNFPAVDIMPPWVSTTGTLGKAGEMDIVDAWSKGGRMLSIPEDPTKPELHQLGFVDQIRWMTASTDLPVLPPGWRKPYIVEVKGKADEVLEEMIKGAINPSGRLLMRPPDKKHILQLKATIGLAQEADWGWVSVCKNCWRIIFASVFQDLVGQALNPAISDERADQDGLRVCPWCNEEVGRETFDLEPPTSGEIYYWSRSWPRKTKSFYYEHDSEMMAAGRSVLEIARESFIADQIPERPHGFQWGLTPCSQCQFYSGCRLDSGLLPRKRKPDPEIQRHVLTQSHLVERTRTIRPHYDPEAMRARVFKEWE